MAIFPWCRPHGRQGRDLADFPSVRRWFGAIAARPAVAPDMARLEEEGQGAAHAFAEQALAAFVAASSPCRGRRPFRS